MDHLSKTQKIKSMLLPLDLFHCEMCFFAAESEMAELGKLLQLSPRESGAVKE